MDPPIRAGTTPGCSQVSLELADSRRLFFFASDFFNQISQKNFQQSFPDFLSSY
jgi:hypothetical protein